MIRKDLAFNGLKAKLITETEEYMVVYFPGRTVYVDSVNGSQYMPSEYVVYKKLEELEEWYKVKEVLRFSRAI